MKKVLSFVLIICTLLGLSAPAFAAGESAAVGTAAVAGVESLAQYYEASVIARMAGRAGASTVDGAKGIAFEVIYSDVKNLFGNFANGLKTALSSSSTDQAADLVTTNRSGEVIELIQCKDGTSATQVRNVLAQVSNGKYENVELAGTEEFAALFNTKAAEAGIEQRATNSHISTETTSRIARDSLGAAPSQATIMMSALKSAGIAAGITAVASIGESIIRGDSFYDATGHVVTNTGISAISVAFGCLTKAEITALLLALGASTAATTVVAGTIGILVPIGVGYALYVIAEKNGFEQGIASLAASLGQRISTVANEIKTFLEDPKMKSNVDEFCQSVNNVADTVVNGITSGWSSVGAWFSGTYQDVLSLGSALFNKA